MPFCPKCKAEYQEGFTVCADCKVELVTDIKAAEELIPFFQADDKKVAEKLVKFFNYSDVHSSLEYDEENENYIVLISPKKQLEAKKLYQAFYFVERERLMNGESDLVGETDASEADKEEAPDSDEPETDCESEKEAGYEFEEEAPETEEETLDYPADSDISSEDNKYRRETPSDEVTAFDEDEKENASSYVMKADQYRDLHGTVWIFLFFGVAGLIFVLLNVLGYLNLFSGWIPYTVMTVLFLFFLYVALSTNQKAKKIQSEIDAENRLTERINEWLKSNITEEFIATKHSENISEELNYIRITDKIKELLIEEFGNQNLAYLDRLIEEYYDKTFDSI